MKNLKSGVVDQAFGNHLRCGSDRKCQGCIVVHLPGDFIADGPFRIDVEDLSGGIAQVALCGTRFDAAVPAAQNVAITQVIDVAADCLGGHGKMLGQLTDRFKAVAAHQFCDLCLSCREVLKHVCPPKSCFHMKVYDFHMNVARCDDRYVTTERGSREG